MANRISIPGGYTPIDDLLAMPATRMMRAMRWFDWARSVDLYLNANVSDDERSACSSALSRLVKDGYAERGDRSSDGWAYRLTSAGRAELAARLSGESPMQRGKRRAA